MVANGHITSGESGQEPASVDATTPGAFDAGRDKTARNGSRNGNGRSVPLLGREVPMPQSRSQRIAVGGLLVLLGTFGFLPLLGFWMIPLGLLMLSYELATVRRWRRRGIVWWHGRKGRRR